TGCGKEALVLDHAVLDAGRESEPGEFERGSQVFRHGLFAVDVLARGDGCAQGGCALTRGLGVEIDLVRGAGQGGIQVSAPTLETVLLGQGTQLPLVSADQQGLGPDELTVAQADPALLADGKD